MHCHPFALRRLSPVTQARAWLLALLLLVAQAAGIAHRVAHAPGLASAAHTVWVDGHESGGTDCRLVDQLVHADALCGAAPALPLALRVARAATAPLPQALPAGTAAVYLARGPPPAPTRA